MLILLDFGTNDPFHKDFRVFNLINIEDEAELEEVIDRIDEIISEDREDPNYCYQDTLGRIQVELEVNYGGMTPFKTVKIDMM